MMNKNGGLIPSILIFIYYHFEIINNIYYDGGFDHDRTYTCERNDWRCSTVEW